MKNFLSLLLALVFLPNCTSNVGESIFVDAATDANLQPDALPPGLRDGEPCIVSNGDDTGGCAPGYACASVGQGFTQCRQTCPTLQFACADYGGPGYSYCALTYNDDEGQPLGNLCLVVCGDDNEMLRGCDDGACDGTCPGVWTCQNDLNNFGIKSCQ